MNPILRSLWNDNCRPDFGPSLRDPVGALPAQLRRPRPWSATSAIRRLAKRRLSPFEELARCVRVHERQQGGTPPRTMNCFAGQASEHCRPARSIGFTLEREPSGQLHAPRHDFRSRSVERQAEKRRCISVKQVPDRPLPKHVVAERDPVISAIAQDSRWVRASMAAAGLSRTSRENAPLRLCLASSRSSLARSRRPASTLPSAVSSSPTRRWEPPAAPT